MKTVTREEFDKRYKILELELVQVGDIVIERNSYEYKHSRVPILNITNTQAKVHVNRSIITLNSKSIWIKVKLLSPKERAKILVKYIKL